MLTIRADRLGQLFANVLPGRHAVALGQKQRGKTVAIHRTVAAGGGDVDESALLRVGKDEFDAAFDIGAVRAAARRAAGGQKGHAGQSADGDVATEASRTKRSFFFLLGGQPGQPALDGGGRGRSHQLDGRLFRIGLLRPVSQPAPVCRPRGQRRRRVAQKGPARGPGGGNIFAAARVHHDRSTPQEKRKIIAVRCVFRRPAAWQLRAPQKNSPTARAAVQRGIMADACCSSASRL